MRGFFLHNAPYAHLRVSSQAGLFYRSGDSRRSTGAQAAVHCFAGRARATLWYRRGNPWSYRISEADKDLTREQLYERKIFPILLNREDRFPEGESLNDLQARAERAIKDIVLPYAKEGAFAGEDIHIAIVSHGLCISELVSALVRLDHFKVNGSDWTGLLNTALDEGDA